MRLAFLVLSRIPSYHSNRAALLGGGMGWKDIMDQHQLDVLLEQWREHLAAREAAPATVRKYVREVRGLLVFLVEHDLELSRSSLLSYKEELLSRRVPSGVNSALAAINGFLQMAGLSEFRVRRLRVQTMTRAAAHPLSRDDYDRLVSGRGGAHDVAVLLAQTLCAMGIRVSELSALSVESLHAGCVLVTNKGRTRRVWIPSRLCRRLALFARRHGVRRGPVFVTRTGRPLDRTRVWRLLKGLARRTGVEESRVYPHNLRHLFATEFERRFHDIDALALLLGHARVETTRAYLAIDEIECRRRVDSLGFV